MNLEGKRIAVFIADEYEDLEAWYPILRFKESGAEVTIIAPDNVPGDSCVSKHGYEIQIDRKAADADPDNYDAALIPGGWAPDRIRRCQNTLNFVRQLNKDGKLLAAICHGGWVLASAAVIDGSKLTSTPAIKDDLINAGAEWVNEEVVVSDNLVTSRHPGDLPVFCKTIISEL